MENDLMLDEEPFVGYMPHDVRAWVQEHHLESELACAMMIVHNRVGVLMHLCDESSDPWVDYAFEAWCALNRSLRRGSERFSQMKTEQREQLIRLTESEPIIWSSLLWNETVIRTAPDGGSGQGVKCNDSSCLLK